jgi:hypothetical protein
MGFQGEKPNDCNREKLPALSSRGIAKLRIPCILGFMKQKPPSEYAIKKSSKDTLPAALISLAAKDAGLLRV